MSRLRLSVPMINKTAICRYKSASAPMTIGTDTSSSSNPKSIKEIPGPSSWPLIGSALHFLPGGEFDNSKGFKMTDDLYKKYGPIVKLTGFLTSPSYIFLFDAEAVALVARGENLMPNRPGFESLTYYRKEYSKKKSLEGHNFKGSTGLITEQGEEWKEFRSTVNPVMLQPKTVKLYTSAIQGVADEFVERMKTLRDENQMIKKDLGLEMNKWALESIGIVALGGRLGCLEPDLPENSPARELIECVHEIHHIGNELDFKPSLWRFYPTKSYKRAMEVYEKQARLSKHFINRAVQTYAQSVDSDGQQEKPVLQKLLDIDENMALIMATDMLFAGVDTATNSMLAAICLLATNPEKQEKLREELLLGENDTYLKACIKEALRMKPVVAGNIRMTSKEYHLCGYRIPKDTYVVFAHEYLSVMEDQYPRPREYIPERWLAPKDDPLYYGKAHPFAMMPFGFGTRQCIGKRIAQLEFESFLSKLIKTFRVEMNGPLPKIESSSLNFLVGPFNFVFKDL